MRARCGTCYTREIRGVQSLSSFQRLSEFTLRLLAVTILGASFGCGGSSSGGYSTPVAAPQIVKQPTDQSVPMGLSGAFGVSASGTGLSYQWSLNGIAIPGATSSTYATPGTAFADSGEAFTVLVSNSAGSVTSVPARLTVTARAPKAGDLRFQQVDSASTVSGYTRSNSNALDSRDIFCPVPGAG